MDKTETLLEETELQQETGKKRTRSSSPLLSMPPSSNPFLVQPDWGTDGYNLTPRMFEYINEEKTPGHYYNSAYSSGALLKDHEITEALKNIDEDKLIQIYSLTEGESVPISKYNDVYMKNGKLVIVKTIINTKFSRKMGEPPSSKYEYKIGFYKIPETRSLKNYKKTTPSERRKMRKLSAQLNSTAKGLRKMRRSIKKTKRVKKSRSNKRKSRKYNK
jgi:hypothetical protein